ncbi:HDOD domain-containing protein [Neptunomonas antarctica]|uniref:HDOD domain-containing protein n=1 Tax=Neptunomonas antarctica TaxID=619304 RepID=A0A1N7KFY8_9GAMM|nr:HDOD domain-containing protein [Neptunomonas antarctica]SIS60518.1 HDOD domain-containing protein [Neptunomonas antarctica]
MVSEKREPPEKNISIMLLDPHGEYLNWSKLLKQTGREWEIFCIDDPDTLISRLEIRHYDAIMLSSSVKDYIELSVLRRAQKIRPETLRFQLGAKLEFPKEMALTLELTHRIFPTPSATEEIAQTIEYLLKVTRLINRPALKRYISQQQKLPAVPQIYQDLTQELNSDSTDARKISAIIERDPTLSAKVIQLVNSSFFGLPRQISHITEAVSMIGTRMLSGLALSNQITSTYPPHKNWKYFSFEKINKRSLLVARLARDICKDAGADKGITEQAFLAGLLHDVGILVMVSQDPASYLKVLQYAVKEEKLLHVAEKKITGVYHGEVGAALMALWNIPTLTVEAILFHPIPQLSEDNSFQPLTAVHVADALIPAAWHSKNTKMNSQLSEAYIERIGHIGDLHRWKLIAYDYKLLMQSN